MKTAISVPNDLFRKVERLAKRARKSRSQLYSDALREYLARHSPDEVTEAINRVTEHIEERDSEFATAAARRILERSEW